MRRLLCLFLMITLCPLLSAAAEEPGTMIPLKPVIPVSTLGAGDSFDAMFLNCIAAGAQIPEAVRRASDYAGEYISKEH